MFFLRLLGSRQTACSMPRTNYKSLTILIGILVFLMILSARAEEKPGMDLHLLVEPSFAYPPIAWPITGAKQTVITPAQIVDGMPQYLTPEEKLRLALSRKQINEIALGNASRMLAKLKPMFFRDGNGVITYAVLESKDPLTASAILAPGFTEMFADTMGPDFLIAIPNRFRIYIFPRQVAPLAEIAEDVAIDFRTTAYPISKEVFTLHEGILSCVGTLEH